MSVYSFIGGPSYRAATPQEQFAAAIDLPMNPIATFFDQAKGGALESFGLGTAIRDFSIPQGTEPREIQEPLGPADTSMVTTAQRAYETLRGIFNPVQQGEPALSEQDWKASPYYRESIPFDPGMTADRAAALAIWEDAKRVREFYAAKNPIVSLVGGFAGQALDPINYVPIAGPAVKAAAVARAGRVGGAIVASSLDAAANTAAFGLLTAPARGEYGDDVSWQATVTEVATAALIGAAFGGIVGVADVRRGRIADRQLATLQDTQTARAALNDAIQGIVQDGEVRLSGSTINALDAKRAASPVFDPNLLADFERPDLFRSTAVGRVIDQRPVEIASLEDALRREVLTADAGLKTRWDAAETKFTEAEARLAELTEGIEGRRLSDAVAVVDEAAAERLRAVEDELAQDVPSARRAALEAERDLIVEGIGREQVEKIDRDARIGPEKAQASARKRLATARREFAAVKREVDGRIRADTTLRQAMGRTVDPALPREDPEPQGRQEAAKEIATPETDRKLAEVHRVDPETGGFAEEADLARLETEGRLTDEDREELAASDQEYQQGVAFSEAIKSFVGCLL